MQKWSLFETFLYSEYFLGSPEYSRRLSKGFPKKSRWPNNEKEVTVLGSHWLSCNFVLSKN